MRIKLTKEIIENAQPSSIISQGLTTNDSYGLNMSDDGRELRFVIFRGGISDWCIYTHTSDHSAEWISTQGDKPHTREFIENVVEFDDEVWGMYRH